MNANQKKLYADVRAAVRDYASEFWTADGKRHTGAKHRNEYWHGYDGDPFIGDKTSLAYACWKAGHDDGKING
jgi:hypothetical protein